MAVRTDDVIGRVLAVSGLWEPNVTMHFARCLSAGDVCVDVGAHAGYYTLLASRLVGERGHVYAFEPSPTNYRALCANLKRNRIHNVTASDVAIGDSAGKAVLHEGPETNTGRATLQPGPKSGRVAARPTVVVDVLPVAASIPTREFGRIRAVKIDVEGYEIEVLRSFVPLFERREPLAVFVEFTPEWVGNPSAAAQSIESIRDKYAFKLCRLRNDSLEDLFPGKLEEPFELQRVPTEQCDLLLFR